MTDNLPAVPDAPASTEIARADTDSWSEVVGETAKFAGYIAGTEFVPKGLRNNAAAVTAAMMYGREVGLPPMTALTQTHVIEGKPAMSAEAMRALVFAAGHELVIEETTGATCTMRARRRGSDGWTSLTWTIDMARAAGVASKQVWKSYPRQMLQARCTTELARLVFPDVIHGFRSVEELGDGSEAFEDMVGGDDPGEAPQATTTVSRSKPAKKTAAKKAVAALPAAPSKPAEQAPPPPLPGEEDEDAAQAPEKPAEPPASDDGDSSSHDETTGQHPEDADEQAAEAGESGEDAADVSPAEDPGSPEPRAKVEEGAGRKASAAQMRMLLASLNETYGEPVDREERLLIASIVLDRPIDSFNDLLVADAKVLIDTLARCKDRGQLQRLLDTIEETRAAERGEDPS